VITYFTHTEPGGHVENEDRLEVIQVPGVPSAYLCAVADGQGGQAGGALAAAIACQKSLKRATTLQVDQLLSPSVWPLILQHADEAVANTENAGYTTLIAFCLTETRLCGGSSGDSAVLLQNAGQRFCLLTEKQRKNPPVGSRGAIVVPFVAPLISPWILLAMTDGVWKYVGWDRITAVLSQDTREGITRQLRDMAALPRTGRLQDDFTLVVFQG
jgi:PPM family protein phosphatase